MSHTPVPNEAQPSVSLPGLDCSDVIAAGWWLHSYDIGNRGHVLVFKSNEDTVTVQGEGYPEALENFRRYLWRDGLLAIRDVSTPDDIRAQGWAVGVHNDYRLHGVDHTFWLFTKGVHCVKGEGRTDAEALNQVRAKLQQCRAERLARPEVRVGGVVIDQPHCPGDPA